MSCDLCEHVFSQAHRLMPGAWGGRYTPENTADLCPNHHVAVHYLMSSWVKHRSSPKRWLSDRMLAYKKDAPLWELWEETVKPICDGWISGLWVVRSPFGPAPVMAPAEVREMADLARTWEPPSWLPVDLPRFDVWPDESAGRVMAYLGGFGVSDSVWIRDRVFYADLFNTMTYAATAHARRGPV